MTLDGSGLAEAIVRHCSPTLVGIKPSCLFNVPGAFAAEQKTADAHARQRAGRRRARLEALVALANDELWGAGVCVRVLAWRHCGALVLVYRPQLLACALGAGRVASKLGEWGYVTCGRGWLEAALDRLGHELERCHRSDPNAGFPHEVGFFLGYPYEDVMGFIEHEGRDYLCCGCWKVYSQKERAEACFASYKRCTRACEALLASGVSLPELAGVRIAA